VNYWNIHCQAENYLLFVVQAFYILNRSGLKRLIIEPTREVMWRDKVTYEGCKKILKALISKKWSNLMTIDPPPAQKY